MPPPFSPKKKKKKKTIYLTENQTFSHVMSALALSLTIIFHWNHTVLAHKSALMSTLKFF